MSDFQAWKNWIIHSTGIEKDGMHVITGMLVFLLAAILLRRPLRDWRPLATVVLVAVAGEIWDMFEYWKAGAPLHPEWSWHDLWVTALCPSLIFALSRWTRLLKG